MFGSGTESFEGIIITILAIIIIIIFGGAIYAFVLSIFQFIFSKGEQEKIKKAWNNIRYMILGIILTILLLFIFPFLFSKLEMPGYKVYTAQNIFKKSSDIIKMILNAGPLDQKEYFEPSNDYSNLEL